MTREFAGVLWETDGTLLDFEKLWDIAVYELAEQLGDTMTQPEPDLYLHGADLLGLEPSNCLAVEDSPTGATSAEQAGCSVLVVPCEIAVPAGQRRVFRETLIGGTLADLRGAWQRA